MMNIYNKIVYVAVLSTVLITNPLYSITSFDSADHRGDYDSSNYIGRLGQRGLLTEDIVKEWLNQTAIFSEDEKKDLTVTVPSKRGGKRAEKIFFVQTQSAKWVLKTWSDDGMGRPIKDYAFFTYQASKAPFLKSFQEDPDLPYLTADIWSGIYKDQSNKDHYVHLMPCAQGIPLDEYLKKGEVSSETWLPLAERLGEVFGKAHATTALNVSENIEKMETKFVFGDPHPENVFISFPASQKPRISLIDLEHVGMNVIEKLPPYMIKPTPRTDIGTIMRHYLFSDGFVIKNAGRNKDLAILLHATFADSYAKAFGENEGVVRKALMTYFSDHAKQTYRSMKEFQCFLPKDETVHTLYPRLYPVESILSHLEDLSQKLKVDFTLSAKDFD
jgi:hypothetical protein